MKSYYGSDVSRSILFTQKSEAMVAGQVAENYNILLPCTRSKVRQSYIPETNVSWKIKKRASLQYFRIGMWERCMVGGDVFELLCLG